MNGARDQLLAGAGLTAHQHVAIRAGNTPHFVQQVTMRLADADDVPHVMDGGDFRAQPLALRAQQRTLALDVYQSQFRRHAIRQHIADGALFRADLEGPIEPRAKVTQHRAVLGRERQAEVGHAALGRVGEARGVDRDQQAFAGVDARAGRSGEVVFIVLDAAVRSPDRQGAGAARGGRLRRSLPRAGATRRPRCSAITGKNSSPRARARLAASNCIGSSGGIAAVHRRCGWRRV